MKNAAKLAAKVSRESHVTVQNGRGTILTVNEDVSLMSWAQCWGSCSAVLDPRALTKVLTSDATLQDRGAVVEVRTAGRSITLDTLGDEYYEWTPMTFTGGVFDRLKLLKALEYCTVAMARHQDDDQIRGLNVQTTPQGIRLWAGECGREHTCTIDSTVAPALPHDINMFVSPQGVAVLKALLKVKVETVGLGFVDGLVAQIGNNILVLSDITDELAEEIENSADFVLEQANEIIVPTDTVDVSAAAIRRAVKLCRDVSHSCDTVWHLSDDLLISTDSRESNCDERLELSHAVTPACFWYSGDFWLDALAGFEGEVCRIAFGPKGMAYLQDPTAPGYLAVLNPQRQEHRRTVGGFQHRRPQETTQYDW
ncbi:MAG: hypothetical protein WC551_08725 [Patescibacteria group bacterium]